MTDIITQGQNTSLMNLQDLSRFVLVGKQRVNAVRAAIRAIQKIRKIIYIYSRRMIDNSSFM